MDQRTSPAPRKDLRLVSGGFDFMSRPMSGHVRHRLNNFTCSLIACGRKRRGARMWACASSRSRAVRFDDLEFEILHLDSERLELVVVRAPVIVFLGFRLDPLHLHLVEEHVLPRSPNSRLRLVGACARCAPRCRTSHRPQTSLSISGRTGRWQDRHDEPRRDSATIRARVDGHRRDMTRADDEMANPRRMARRTSPRRDGRVVDGGES